MDAVQALDLTALICDIEPAQRKDGEFFVVYRKDTHPELAKRFLALTRKKFGRTAARMARNHDIGWPAGSNMLAMSAFIEMELLQREGLCQHDGFLLFEPDCIPLAADWIDQLSAEWELTKQAGKEACGHWHQQGDPSTLHMNGNAVFATSWFSRHANLLVGSGMMGWDYFFREAIIQLSRDTHLIFQHYNRWGADLNFVQSIEKNGQRPCFFHGIKTDDGRTSARQMILGQRYLQPIL